MIALKKKNGKAMLGKVYPTSKQCLKFTMQSEMELDMELIPSIINVLQSVSASGEQSIIVVDEYEDYKKERKLSCSAFK